MTFHPPTYRILVVDDQKELADDVVRELVDALGASPHYKLELETEGNFDEAERRLLTEEFDVVVLDVRRERQGQVEEDRQRGEAAFEVVRKSRFLPVIFYTALPEEVQHLEALPLIAVVSKDELERVPGAVHAALDSGVPLMTRTLQRHVSDVLRTYLWDQVAPNFSEYTGDDRVQTAQLLVARVAHSIRETGLPALAHELASAAFELTDGREDSEGAAATYYVYPPVTDALMPGTLLVEGQDGSEQWWVVLTPACDIAQDKVEFLLLAKAITLPEFEPFQQWKNGHSQSKWQRLERIFKEGLPRYAFLPEFREIPDLVIDFEQVTSVPTGSTGHFGTVATLDSPYVEALLARHSQFRGRIGTPDLDIDALKARLLAVTSEDGEVGN